MRLAPTPVRAFVAIAVLFVAACSDSIPTAPENTPATLKRFDGGMGFARSKGARRADHALVQLRGAESGDFAAAITKLGGTIERRIPQVNYVVVKGLSESAAASLALRGDVADVTHDVRIQWIPAASTARRADKRDFDSGVDQSTAAFYPFQWNIHVTKADQAWGPTPAGRNAKVYVLDTGIDPFHIDLAGRVDLAKSRTFVDDPAEPPDFLDYNLHGTATASIIVSNGIGIASVAPLAQLVAVKVLDTDGGGSFADVIEGIVYAANQGADVINMSLGAYGDLTVPEDRELIAHLQVAIAYARFKGAVVVASAGNDAVDLIALPSQFLHIPSDLIGVIGVGATAPVNQVGFDQIASYSNFGWKKSAFGGVQIFAPGGDLVDGGSVLDFIFFACSQYQVTQPFTCGPADYLLDAGTSLSAPMVSGEAAVLRSILGGSTLASLVNVACILEGTDNIGPKAVFGNGRMNVLKAAKCASKGGKH